MPIGQGSVSISFFAKHGDGSDFSHERLLRSANVAGIGIHFLRLIVGSQQGFDHLGVVNIGGRRVDLHDQLGKTAHLRVELVAEKGLVPFLRPTGINVLLAFLRRLINPELLAFPGLDGFVFLRGVALNADFRKGRVDDPTISFPGDRCRLQRPE